MPLARHSHVGLALPSDSTDAECALLEPFFPPPSHVGLETDGVVVALGLKEVIEIGQREGGIASGGIAA